MKKSIFIISLITIALICGTLLVSFIKSNQNIISQEILKDKSCLTNKEHSSINQNISNTQKQILTAAKARTKFQVTYLDKYYSDNQGKPPDNEGVCTDLFWRSLEGANIDFQEVLYKDMVSHTSDYPLDIWGMTKPNKFIDFRRVPNIEAYLDKYAKKLTNDVNPCDLDNLKEWQAGDIVIFKIKNRGLSDHIAIISDIRESNGLPYLIHNYGIGEVEKPGLTRFGKIVGHYRLINGN